MWSCPECGRKFARNRQSHSCIQYNLDTQFQGKEPITRELFDILVDNCKKLGEIEVYPGKYYITLRRLSTFVSVMAEKNHLTITFLSGRPVEEFPVYQNYQYSSHRWANLLKVESAEELDNQLFCWLKEAYEIAI